MADTPGTCRYCDTETNKPCCGAPACRRQHGARLLGQLADVLDGEADREGTHG
jgi:hypothetical protein